MEDLSDIDGAVPRRAWQKTWVWVVAAIVASVLSCGACFFDIPGFFSGETDLLGNYTFEEEQDEADAEMTPMERLHAEHFPRWLISAANRRASAEADYATLFAAIEDAELQEVVTELRNLIDTGDLTAPPDVPVDDMGAAVGPPDDPHYFQLLERWNARLKTLGASFYVTGSISSTPAGPALLCQFYRRLAEPTVDVDGRSYQTVILQRIDRTNIVESYLGVANRGGSAVVVTDRILDLATDSVWLMLNPETAPTDPLAASYASAIREEARSGLGEETYAALAESAIERRRLLDTIDSVLARSSCGSRMQFGYTAWDGLNPRTLNRLDAYAERDKIQPCPTIKFEEADTLRETSEALRADSTKRALQSLVAWLTRMVTLHEARHAADNAERAAHDEVEGCPGCPARMRRNTRAELSAYVATIAWSDSPATAMYQACTVTRGPHGRAMQFFNGQLGRRCEDPPTSDLASKARELEAELFGSAPKMTLPDDFPSQLEIHRYR